MGSRGASRPFYGFFIVAACFFILFMLWGMVINTFPVFLKPIAEDMDWGRGALSIAVLMGAIGSAVTAPLAGVTIDRIGARPVMSMGALVIGLALLAGSRITHLWELYLVFVVIGFGLMCSTVIPCSLLISNWFVSRRGTAMGAAFVGTSAGGMIMAPVANWIILHHGWRAAFSLSGTSILLLVAPVILFVVRTRPSEIGLEPYHDQEAEPGAIDESPGVGVWEALSLKVFWQIAAIMLMVGMVTGGMGGHGVAYLTDLEHSSTRASFAWSVVMAAMVLGKLLLGPIADRSGPRATMAGACVLLSLSIGILMFAEPYWVVLASAGLYGFACGAPLVVTPLLAGHYLGTENFGAIYGLLNIMATLGIAVGPVGAGLFFDAHETYLPVFSLFVGLMLLTATLATLMKRPRLQQRAGEKCVLAGGGVLTGSPGETATCGSDRAAP